MASTAGVPVEIQGASKQFVARGTTVDAVTPISLSISAGEFVSVVGPSGCGKTTLLRMIAGLVSPTKGQILLGGKRASVGRKDVSMVFQRPTLLPWATVEENVTFPSRLRKQPREQARAKAQQLLRLVHLEGFDKHYPAELSGGMQQRVSLCRALIEDPAVLLMDEPFGALDALTREVMNVELERIWLASPRTVVFITHSISEAVLLSDRVIVMSKRPGRVAGIVDVPLRRPRDPSAPEDRQAFSTIESQIRSYLEI